jgi:hypothetical protein
MDSEERDKQRRKQLILQAVQDQLASPDSPEVKEHYDRLRSLGESDSEARELIAAVLAAYIWHTLREDDYTYTDYVNDLAKLPEIEWADEENEDE